jgi:putative ABC transport system permease protein
MASVIAGVFVIILGQGFIGGLTENIIRAEVDSLSGHVLIRPLDYPDAGLQHPVDELVTPSPELMAHLDANTEAWTRRTLFTPTLTYKIDSVRVRAIAYDPDRDEAVFPRETWRVQGVVPTTADEGVLLSKGVAGLLDLDDDAVDVLIEVRTTKGAINAERVPIAGRFTTGNPIIDKVAILVPDDLADRLIRNGDSASHLVARLADRREALAAEDQLAALLPEGAATTTWVAQTKDMLALQEIRRSALNILAAALLAMAATGIANTVLMAAYERIREIGTLRAMGLTKRGVLALFISEGAFMGMVGAIIGAILGGALVYNYSVNGIDMSSALENASTGNIPIAAMLYLEFSWPVVAVAMCFGVSVAIMASIYPAYTASNLRPAEAVRAD